MALSLWVKAGVRINLGKRTLLEKCLGSKLSPPLTQSPKDLGVCTKVSEQGVWEVQVRRNLGDNGSCHVNLWGPPLRPPKFPKTIVMGNKHTRRYTISLGIRAMQNYHHISTAMAGFNRRNHSKG
jgi:hypothetical protein